MGAIMLVVFFLWELTQGNQSKVVFLDVGQGSGAYISVDGIQIIIDAGETNKTLRELGRVHTWWDRSIDLVVASHSDKDHIGMIPEIVSRYDVSMYLETGKENESPFQHAVHEELNKKKTRYMIANAPESIDIGDNAVLTVLHPTKGSADTYSDNDSSLIVLLQVKGITFLFMGDAGVEVEKELIQKYGTQLEVDVLVVGHHGSKSSTSQELLDVTKPQYGVISAGADNRYGHPHQSVLERLQRNNIQTLRTDELGTIEFMINNDGEFDIVVR